MIPPAHQAAAGVGGGAPAPSPPDALAPLETLIAQAEASPTGQATAQASAPSVEGPTRAWFTAMSPRPEGTER